VHIFNSWATPTPILEAGRLYCDFGTYGTACLDAPTGKVLWTQQLPLDHQVGPGSSPATWGNRLLLVRDGRNAQFIAGLDETNGQILWKTDRPPLEATRNEVKKSFCTPLVIQAAGRAQAIIPGAQWVVSYDPETGKELWRVRHGKGFSLASRPVFGHGLVYICTGSFSNELWAIRPDGQGNVTDTHVAWKAKPLIPVMSSPILVEDIVYCVSDQGIASAFDAKNGSLLWRERLGGSYMASPVFAAGRLYFFNRDGKTTVLAPGRKFERLAENQLDGPLVATPAFVGNAVFLRTDSHLYRIQAR
jgi:outer membrane protein assembly factor BamB